MSILRPLYYPLLAVLCLGIVTAPRPAHADGESPSLARGGRVGWARLITESRTWSVHGENDPVLATFIRSQTSLNIDPVCYPVDPHNLEALCAYPFIFTNNLANVHDATSLANLREYLRRGGFIYADRCVNPSMCPPMEVFYEQHVGFFSALLPESDVRELPDDHEIYQCYFTFKPSEMPEAVRNRPPGHNRLYGVFAGGRMVALFSNESLQCGWPYPPPKRRATSLKMIANIYVYAMTHAVEGPAPSP